MSGTMDSRSSRRTGRSNVKSGCRTCKIRKVKCDEGRPACHRCVSTGRVCDGYGIWGGGGNYYGHRQCPSDPKDSPVVPWSPAGVPVLSLGTGPEVKWCFEWFTCRTAPKLPGSFISGFWSTLLPQASLNEPAVLHAVLALSSVHKRGIINADRCGKSDNVPDEPEQFTLQHYVKAISHLQSHFSTKDRASFRVALITCVVFVCLEFLRGHFETGQIHLQNGLKMLGEMQTPSDEDGGILRLKPHCESTDDLIIEAFSRLHLQLELFKHPYQHPSPVPRAAGPCETPALVFHSLNQAWRQMERLLNEIFHLTHLARQQVVPECEDLQHPYALLGQQQRIRAELGRWLEKYEAFLKALQGHQFGGVEKAYQLLRMYHTMATIMAGTCLRPRDELAFDSHTNQFALLIKQSTTLSTLASTDSSLPDIPRHLVDMSRTVVDVGWIPPLYYAAVKCRVHQIRLQAIRLLESTTHREGIWDAMTAACVATRVMEIEERDFYKDLPDTANDFPPTASPCPRDLSLPALPESYRIREAEVVLSGTPMDKILLFCRQKQEGTDCRVLLSEYNVRLRRWTPKQDTSRVQEN